jgi:tetratricopeptide (TPR) repeat protein
MRYVCCLYRACTEKHRFNPQTYLCLQALTVYDQVISILELLPDCDKSKVADTYTRIADIFSRQNKFETSLDALKQALKLHSEVHGSDSVQVAKILVHLGSAYKHLENIDRAMGCFSEGIKILRSTESDTKDEYLMSQAMVDLGKIYARMNMFDKAIELCTESLRLLKQNPSIQVGATVADVYLTVAEILIEWGKVEQALKFYEQALISYEETLGPDSTAAATCHYGIAMTHKKEDDPQTALRSFGQALRIHRSEGDKTLSVANDLFQIGQIYDSYGETSKAYQCFHECLKIRQANLSEDDLELLAVRRYVDKLQRKMNH